MNSAISIDSNDDHIHSETETYGRLMQRNLSQIFDAMSIQALAPSDFAQRRKRDSRPSSWDLLRPGVDYLADDLDSFSVRTATYGAAKNIRNGRGDADMGNFGSL